MFRKALAIVTIGLFAPLAQVQAANPPSPTEWTVLASFDPKVLQRWASVARPDPSGAVNVNRSAYQNVGLQRETIDQIPLGVLTKNPSLIQSSLSIMSYAFAHQNSDGSFQFTQDQASIRAGFPADTASASTAAFFMYDLGHSLLLLDESPWFRSSPQTANARQMLETSIKPKAATSLNWLVSQANALKWDDRAINRVLVYGAAYYLCGQALNNSKAVQLGRQFIQQALARQTQDGVLPEAEGFDSSYQAVSLYLLDILYLHVVPNDVALKKAIWSALSTGAPREMQAIGADGSIDVTNNSRVKRADHVDRRSVLLSLQYYAAISHDTNARSTATHVLKRSR